MFMDLYELMAALAIKAEHSALVDNGYEVSAWAQSGRVLYVTYTHSELKLSIADVIQWEWDNDKGWQVKYHHCGRK